MTTVFPMVSYAFLPVICDEVPWVVVYDIGSLNPMRKSFTGILFLPES